MASLINTIGMVIGAIGIFAGFYFLPTDPALALRWERVCLWVLLDCLPLSDTSFFIAATPYVSAGQLITQNGN